MSNFKQMLEADRAVFLNPEEFGEEHTVEGRSITVVIDEAILVESKRAEELGLAQGDIVLFGKSEDLPDQRSAGQSLNIDGREYIVAEWRVDYGVAKIYLCQTTLG